VVPSRLIVPPPLAPVCWLHRSCTHVAKGQCESFNFFTHFRRGSRVFLRFGKLTRLHIDECCMLVRPEAPIGRVPALTARGRVMAVSSQRSRVHLLEEHVDEMGSSDFRSHFVLTGQNRPEVEGFRRESRPTVQTATRMIGKLGAAGPLGPTSPVDHLPPDFEYDRPAGASVRAPKRDRLGAFVCRSLEVRSVGQEHCMGESARRPKGTSAWNSCLGIIRRVVPRLERVRRLAKDAAEYAYRIFEEPRSARHRADSSALLGDSSGLCLTKGVLLSLRFEPSSTAHSDISARGNPAVKTRKRKVQSIGKRWR